MLTTEQLDRLLALAEKVLGESWVDETFRRDDGTFVVEFDDHEVPYLCALDPETIIALVCMAQALTVDEAKVAEIQARHDGAERGFIERISGLEWSATFGQSAHMDRNMLLAMVRK